MGTKMNKSQRLARLQELKARNLPVQVIQNRRLMYSHTGAHHLACKMVTIVKIDAGHRWEPLIVMVKHVNRNKPEYIWMNALDLILEVNDA